MKEGAPLHQPTCRIGSIRPPTSVKPELESDDPFEAVAMRLPAVPGTDPLGEMARCMVEEYALMGFTPALLMKMFKNPFYQALHGVYQVRGEGFVEELLGSVFQPQRCENASAPMLDGSSPEGGPHA